MPTKNVVRVFVPDAFFHVYNRGWNLGKIFIDDDDYLYFQSLLRRHLSPEVIKDKKGREYKNFSAEVHLAAYCLMGNHFHSIPGLNPGFQTTSAQRLSVSLALSTACTMSSGIAQA